MATQNAINVGIVPGGGYTYTFPAGTGTLYSTLASSITSSQLLSSMSDETGSGALVFGTSPRITTSILDSNGATMFGFVPEASAVNYLEFTNRAAGSPPKLAAVGTDTDISLNLSPKGVGQVIVNGIPVMTTSGTQSVTNKRNKPRTASSTSNATLTPDLSSANVYFRTTQTTGLTIEAPTGTPVIGETIAIYVDSAGAQTLTMNATYKAFGSAFPASTTEGKTLMIVAQYNGTNWKSTWSTAV